ncbi:MAG: tRNA nucleotidyltransferase [Hydrogenibacillus schlegelii]|uniref:tRNA nucleotidyltransferase n=1 Tax=Hydrogenibacillus schlegelii TaxID=1484 RepID=A0A2T5G867_HYDSH|nr:hypothetical protein [Hydrogenibacillus schlegelii]PTQ52374.1 MAG: tRNA nucleotidyltransferase [Hydrogenibacillus schlegelii]
MTRRTLPSGAPVLDASLWETPLWAAARRVIRTIEAAGHAAFVVGGAVRDRLLGLPASEIDIATSMRPEAVRRLFPRTHPTGERFGTVTVVEGGFPFEVTTFRVETYPSVDRHPAVRFTGRLEDDLARRDFTINAMALSADGRLIDPFDGRRDLERRVLRTVGDPAERFREDPLRLIRAIRFAVRYGLRMAPETWRALVALRGELVRVAPERIVMEMEKSRRGAEPWPLLRWLDRADLWLRLGEPAIARAVAAADPPDVFWAAITAAMRPARGLPPSGAGAIAGGGAPLGEGLDAEAGAWGLRLPLSREARRLIRAALGMEASPGRESAGPSVRPRSLEAAYAREGRFDGRTARGGDRRPTAPMAEAEALPYGYAWGTRGAAAVFRALRLADLIAGRPRPETLARFRALAEFRARLPLPDPRRLRLDLGAWRTSRKAPAGPYLEAMRRHLWLAVNRGFPNAAEALEAEADRLWREAGAALRPPFRLPAFLADGPEAGDVPAT